MSTLSQMTLLERMEAALGEGEEGGEVFGWVGWGGV